MSHSIVPWRNEFDENGVLYEKISIDGDGYCGYRCLAYSVFGDQDRTSLFNIISDCNGVLEQHPELYIQRCDTMPFSQYRQFFHDYYFHADMIPEELWMGDAQLLSLAVLYDIAVFCLRLPQRKWVAYNQLGTRGYVCLVNSGRHFEVLRGPSGSPPAIPIHADWQNIDQSANMPPFCVTNVGQAHYPFANVWKWPGGSPQPVMSYGTESVQIINVNIQKLSPTDVVVRHFDGTATTPINTARPATLASTTRQRRTVAECMDDDSTGESASSDKLSNTSSANSISGIIKKIPLPIRKCDFCSTKFKGSNLRALNMHLVRNELCKKAYLARADAGSHTFPISSQTPAASNRHFPDQLVADLSKTQISGDEKVQAYLASLRDQRRTRFCDTSQASITSSGKDNSSVFKKPIPPKQNKSAIAESQQRHFNLVVDLTKDNVLYDVRNKHDDYINELEDDFVSGKSSGDSTEGSLRRRVKRRKCTIGRRFKGKMQGSLEHSSLPSAMSSQPSMDAAPEGVSDMDIGSPEDDVMSIINDSDNNTSQQRSSDRLKECAYAKRASWDSTSRKQSAKAKAEEHLKNMYKKYPPIKPEQVTSDCALYQRLKQYHDALASNLDHVATMKITEEISKWVSNVKDIDTPGQKFMWNKEDEKRLNAINKRIKNLKVPPWPWAAADGSPQGNFNDERMKFFCEHECQFKFLHCPDCHITCILVGLDQINNKKCVNCLRRAPKQKEQELKAWESVKPKATFPKRRDAGHEEEDLPELTPGEKAVIAAVHPVVTIQRNSLGTKKYKQESITLVHDPKKTWAEILPRRDLKDRFIIVERKFKKAPTKYIVANPAHVEQWLYYLFENHKKYTEMKRNGLMINNPDELAGLKNRELAAVIEELSASSGSDGEDEDQPVQYAMDAGLSKKDIYTFDYYPQLYLRTSHKIKLEKNNRIRIIRDDDPQSRKPCYDPAISDNLAFPHLFPHAELTPTDFESHTLNRKLLKKLIQFAQVMGNGRLRWNHAEDGVFVMHQFARVVEREVSATVGWYVSQRPETANISLDTLLQAFKNGASDEGLLECQMPDLQGVMAKIRNSRESWYAERLGIEATARDNGDANVFFTLNMDPRAWPDVRNLIYKLEHGVGAEMPANYFEKDTDKFTELLEKYAWQISVYLQRKAKLLMKAFFFDICHVSPDINKQPLPGDDMINRSWLWSRVEFTATRGVQHFHCLVKLPYVLDTGILGRMTHNGRVLREQLKHGNIKPKYMEQAWEAIEMGQLAGRYIATFAESISQASFFSQPMGQDEYDPSKVINLETFRDKYVNDYKAGNISLETHPIMRDYRNTAECDPNPYQESAKVAAVSCMHGCMDSCGGDKKTGSGCRFGYPKKKLNYTVPAVMQVNEEQMEVQVLLRRTCDRVPNVNRYLLRYLRSNHDMTVLVDVAHKMRYAAKYVAKSGEINPLLEEVIERMDKAANGLFPPTTKQVMRHLLLASCAHNTSMSKSELMYKALDLPVVIKTFPNVKVVGMYNRVSLIETTDRADKQDVVEYSDRTEYSAYAERCRKTTELKNFTRSEMETMNFRTFCETVGRQWKQDRSQDDVDIDPQGSHRKLRSRNINSGHWILSRNKTRLCIRSSTVLNTQPAKDYESPLQMDILYHDMEDKEKKMLYRAYQELIWYCPWKDSPDKSFLKTEIMQDLENPETDPEIKSRYSRRRLEAFHAVYMEKCDTKQVAQPGTKWHRDNQYSYTMYMTSRHNKDIRLDRLENKGVLPTVYEEADELADTGIEIRSLAIEDELDNIQYPGAENYLPADMLNDIQNQPPLKLDEISAGFPMSHEWQSAHEMMTRKDTTAYLAKPPPPSVPYEKLSKYQQVPIDLLRKGKEKILYISGKAGTGKTQIALHICQLFKGRVQAGACTGLAAKNLGGPTIHTMFGWSHFNTLKINDNPKKLQELRLLYTDVDCFVFDEADAFDAVTLQLIDQAMCELFCRRKNGKIIYEPFGGKIVVFLGDAGQLAPVVGEPIWGDGSKISHQTGGSSRKIYRSETYREQTKKGQKLYRHYLMTHCILLNRGQRNSGLLQATLDRVRDGKQTEEDLEKILYQKQKFPNVKMQFGVHYSNDMCTTYNYTELWDICKTSNPPLYMHVSRATYHNSGSNDNIISVLSRIPASDYGYAQDVLCLTEGADIRLIRNINVNAGLVNSAIGRVVKVIYDNADVQSLLDGKYPPPFCIVADFPDFTGIPDKNHEDVRKYPFPHQKTWVPLFRERFQTNAVPTKIRKLQSPTSCWREQFPCDLSRHLTAHRAQGQTWRDCLVSVDLGLASPNARLPADLSSILYVACSRVTELKNLFVSAIHPTIWKQLGNSDADQKRRLHEEQLLKASEQFAKRDDFLKQYQFEHADQATAHKREELQQEWENLCNQKSNTPPQDANILHTSAIRVTCSPRDHPHSPSWVSPVRSERHIGVDQGIRNFAISAVDKIGDEQPKIVGMEHYDLTKLGLGGDVKQMKAASIVTILCQTKLLSWMQKNETKPLLPHVDRVIVHIEQMAKTNQLHMEFGVNLGRELQKQVDPQQCIVKMSQPTVHRANGPMFKMGSKIIEDCNLQPSVYGNARQMEQQESVVQLPKPVKEKIISKPKRVPPPPSDVEPSDESDKSEHSFHLESAASSTVNTPPDSERGSQCESDDSLERGPKKRSRAIQNKHYRMRKNMSKAIFQYVVNATLSDLQDMQLTIDPEVQKRWREQTTVRKFDDLGDSLLHALNEVLCGSTNYRQLIPSTPALHNNRTVIIQVIPDKVFYVVLHCTWNLVTLEYFGADNIDLQSLTYKTQSTVDKIRDRIELNDFLLAALTDHSANGPFLEVSHIQVVVKMLKGYEQIGFTHFGLTRLAAGSLTQATFDATKSTLLRASKKQGVKSFTEKFHSGTRVIFTTKDDKKYSISKSAGKHTNAILSCLEWMRLNVPTLITDRQLYLDNANKELFFNAVKKTAESPPDDTGFHQMEKIRIGEAAIERLCDKRPFHADKKCAIADLILIGLNHNEQYVSAISSNFRKRTPMPLESTKTKQPPASDKYAESKP